VGEFAAAGFEDELAEVVGFGGLELLFWEAVKPGCAIGKEMFPASDEKVFFVEVVWLWGDGRERADEAAVSKLLKQPGDRQMNSGDAKAIEQRDGDVGEFEPHGERSVDGATFPGGFHAFLLIEERLEKERLIEQERNREEESGEDRKIPGHAEAEV